ncbi:MAG: transporter [Bacteroidota bacterium]
MVGYDYRQLTGDSGSAPGPFKGSVDAIGAGLSYTTIVDKTPFIFNLRHYQEFNAENRWEGNSTIASATIRY